MAGAPPDGLQRPGALVVRTVTGTTASPGGRQPLKMGQLPDALNRNGHVFLKPSAGNAVRGTGMAIGQEAT